MNLTRSRDPCAAKFIKRTRGTFDKPMRLPDRRFGVLRSPCFTPTLVHATFPDSPHESVDLPFSHSLEGSAPRRNPRKDFAAIGRKGGMVRNGASHSHSVLSVQSVHQVEPRVSAQNAMGTEASRRDVLFAPSRGRRVPSPGALVGSIVNAKRSL